jgi:hypothetical protein
MVHSRNMTALQKKIDATWFKRVLGDLDSVQAQLVELKMGHDIAFQRWDNQRVAEFVERGLASHVQLGEFRNQMSVLLLELSLSRWVLTPLAHSFSYEALHQLLFPVHQHMSFWYWNELGIAKYLRNEFQTALDFFYQGLRVARDDRCSMKQHIAWINIINSLENLGLAFAHAIKKINLLKRTMTGDLADKICEHHAQMLDAVELRQKFRTGRIAKVFAVSSLSQSYMCYFRSWVQALPYHNFYLPPQHKSTMASFRRFQGGYRQRTLLGLVHSDDGAAHKISDIVERIYLWTWRALVDPQCADRLLSQIHVLFTNKALHLGVEDQCQLQLALGWLSLFCPELKILQRQQPLTWYPNIYPLYDYEYLFIQYFAAKVRNDIDLVTDLMTLIKHHPLHKHRELVLRELVEDVSSSGGVESPLSRVRVSIDDVIARAKVPLKSLEDPIDQHHLLIDEARHLVKFGNQRVISQTLADAMMLLAQRDRISMSEFFCRVFHMREYRADVHESKIYNLLTRVKKIAGERLTVKVRNSVMICSNSLRSIVLIRKNELQESLMRSGLIVSAPGSEMGENQETSAKEYLNFLEVKAHVDRSSMNAFRRVDIEKLLRIPRSSANRWLDRLQRAGVLRREGSGKTVRYLKCIHRRTLGDHDDYHPSHAT